MSLAKTLIKVAIGIAVAKGVSTLVKGGQAAGNASAGNRPSGLDDIMSGMGDARQPGTGHRYDPQGGTGAGLDDLLGQLTGQKPATPRGRSNAPKGGLEDMLGTGQSGQGGGLGDLLGQLAGAGQSAGRAAPGGGGGLGDLLGQLTGAAGGQSGAGGGGGGLGDLLGQLTGAAQGGRGAVSGGGGLGDLLGAVLGGVAGGALSGGASSGGASSRQEDLAAALILRAMVAAVKSDGELDAGEKRKLTEQMDGASQAEIDFINAELERRTNVEELASQVPEGMEAQIYLMSLMAINLDNRREAQHLDQLAKALSLSPREVNALHDRAGVAALYS